MHLVRRHFLASTYFVTALTAVACGQGSATLSPTGPTASLGDTVMSTDVSARTSSDEVETSSILAKGGNGQGKGNQGGGDSDRENKEGGAPGNPGKSNGVLSGFVTATNGTSLTVQGITVTPAAGAVIRHGNRILTFASIVVGDHVQVRGTTIEGSLQASEIKVEHTGNGDDDGDDDGEVEGIISGLTATTGCPVLSFMVGTTAVRTTATTEFDDVLCSALANGAAVEIEGTRQTDGSIVATKVELEDDGDDDQEVEGLVSGLPSGTCPALTFTVGTKQVTTSASTTFKDVTCATLVNGMKVEVKGALQMNGSIAAAEVELD